MVLEPGKALAPSTGLLRTARWRYPGLSVGLRGLPRPRGLLSSPCSGSAGSAAEDAPSNYTATAGAALSRIHFAYPDDIAL